MKRFVHQVEVGEKKQKSELLSKLFKEKLLKETATEENLEEVKNKYETLFEELRNHCRGLVLRVTSFPSLWKVELPEVPTEEFTGYGFLGILYCPEEKLFATYNVLEDKNFATYEVKVHETPTSAVRYGNKVIDEWIKKHRDIQRISAIAEEDLRKSRLKTSEIIEKLKALSLE